MNARPSELQLLLQLLRLLLLLSGSAPALDCISASNAAACVCGVRVVGQATNRARGWV
jgi:hypothetical protein